MSFPSLERATYFSVAWIASTTHVEPLQLIPELFAVTVGVPVGVAVAVAVAVALGKKGPAETGIDSPRASVEQSIV